MILSWWNFQKTCSTLQSVVQFNKIQDLSFFSRPPLKILNKGGRVAYRSGMMAPFPPPHPPPLSPPPPPASSSPTAPVPAGEPPPLPSVPTRSTLCPSHLPPFGHRSAPVPTPTPAPPLPSPVLISRSGPSATGDLPTITYTVDRKYSNRLQKTQQIITKGAILNY
jgi:hypothetical protein